MSDPFGAALPGFQQFSRNSMPDSFVVLTGDGFVPDGVGGGTYTATGTRGPFDARKSRAGDAEEQEMGGQFQVLGAEVMKYPIGTELSASETIRYTPVATGEFIVYEVLFVAERSTYAAHERALIRKVS